MADDADWAAGITEAERERLLARRGGDLRATTADPGPDCMACGDPISEGRRRALPNACLCIDCQAKLEGGFNR